MAGSGLQELIEIMFAGNAVRHMLTGKAISRAVRGHMLVDAALNTIPVAKAYHSPLSTKEIDGPKRDAASTDPEKDDDRPTEARHCWCYIWHNRSEITPR